MIPGGGVGFALALAWSLCGRSLLLSMVPRVDFFQLGTVRRWRGRSLAGFCLVVGGELQLCTVRRCFVLAGSAFGLPDGAGRGLCSRFGVVALRSLPDDCGALLSMVPRSGSPAVNGAAVPWWWACSCWIL